MSVRCQSWVYENSEARGNDRLVLLAIADEADDDGTNAHPGIDRIAHKARVNKRTTMRCIDRLEAEGWLVVERPEKRGRGHFNTYRVVMGKGDDLPPFETARKGREKARIGALPYGNGDRPIDPPTPRPVEPDVISVFETWRTSTARNERTRLDAKRRATIKKALAAYPLDDVLDAVRGWERSAYHRGENPQGTKYNDLSLLLRDAEHVERFRDLWRNPPRSNGRGRYADSELWAERQPHHEVLQP